MKVNANTIPLTLSTQKQKTEQLPWPLVPVVCHPAHGHRCWGSLIGEKRAAPQWPPGSALTDQPMAPPSYLGSDWRYRRCLRPRPPRGCACILGPPLGTGLKDGSIENKIQRLSQSSVWVNGGVFANTTEFQATGQIWMHILPTSKKIATKQKCILVRRKIQWKPGGGEQREDHVGHSYCQSPSLIVRCRWRGGWRGWRTARLRHTEERDGK